MDVPLAHEHNAHPKALRTLGVDSGVWQIIPRDGQLGYRGYAVGFRGDRIAGASRLTVTVSGLVVTHHPRTDFRRPPSSYYLREARHRTPRRASIRLGCSSMAERSTVNRVVGGSTPPAPAVRSACSTPWSRRFVVFISSLARARRRLLASHGLVPAFSHSACHVTVASPLA